MWDDMAIMRPTQGEGDNFATNPISLRNFILNGSLRTKLRELGIRIDRSVTGGEDDRG